MYQPALGRFLSRDPDSPDGIDVLHDNNSFGAALNRMQDLYGYVRNNPLRYVDPSGAKAEEQPKKNVVCKVSLCTNPIAGLAGGAFAHLFILLQRTVNGKQVEWAYRGGPGEKNKRGKDCDLTKTKFGQLIGTDDQYKEGFVDWVPPEKRNCKDLKVNADDCETLHRCFSETLNRVDKCCIEYNPAGYNSNAVAFWVLQNCLNRPGLIPDAPALPPGVRLTPGWRLPRPKCLTEKEPRKEAACPTGDQSSAQQLLS